MSERIKSNMSIMDMVLTMSENNPGAMTVLMEMIPDQFLDVLLLDSKGIYGSKIWMLSSDCCDRNPEKFKRTLKFIRCGNLSNQQIHENLDRTYAVPFIDDSIEMEGVPPYGEEFGPAHPLWEKWCEAQKASFINRTKA